MYEGSHLSECGSWEGSCAETMPVRMANLPMEGKISVSKLRKGVSWKIPNVDKCNPDFLVFVERHATHLNNGGMERGN
jgi:hypothetical protein